MQKVDLNFAEIIKHTPVIANSLAVWSLGQMGLVVKGPDAIIYIDPCLTDIIEERAFPPPIAPENVTHANYVLTTHEHFDHLDPQTIKGIAQANSETQFVVTGWSLDIIDQLDIGSDRLIVPEALAPMTLAGTTLRLTAVPAAHYEIEHDTMRGNRWLGYLIEWNGVTLYHSGDTILYEGYEEMMLGLPAVDVAIVAANGRDFYREQRDLIGNLWPVELARVSKHLNWDLIIPGHNDLLPGNTIPYAQHVEAIERENPAQKFKILRPGELLYYVKT